MRSKFPSPSSLKQQNVLHEEWDIIPLVSVQNLPESVPRKKQAVLQADGGSTLLIKTCVSFTRVSIILSISCIFRILDTDGPG